MGNMSYCRFRNTLGDLYECEEALLEGEELSADEDQAKRNLVKLCARIVQDYGDD